MCIYVCIHVCIYIYIYIHTCYNMHIHVCCDMHIHMCMYIADESESALRASRERAGGLPDTWRYTICLYY